MAEDARRAAHDQQSQQLQRDALEQDRHTQIIKTIDGLVMEFLGAARELGVEPQQRQYAKRSEPKYYQIFLEGRAHVWIQSTGAWDFCGYPRTDRSLPLEARYLDPTHWGLWRQNFQAALTRRIQGYNEPHGA
jgi:hypothetical protein